MVDTAGSRHQAHPVAVPGQATCEYSLGDIMRPIGPPGGPGAGTAGTLTVRITMPRAALTPTVMPTSSRAQTAAATPRPASRFLAVLCQVTGGLT